MKCGVCGAPLKVRGYDSSKGRRSPVYHPCPRLNDPKAHPARSRFWIAPASDPRDRYAAGYNGNRFATKGEAQQAIESLRRLGGEWDVAWVVNKDETP